MITLYTPLMHCLNLNNILCNQQKPIAFAMLRYYVMEKVGLSSFREEILSKQNIN